MQKRKAGQPHKGWKDAARQSRTTSAEEIFITDHAIERFAERVMSVPLYIALQEMRVCLAAAKQKHFRRVGKKKTAYIATGCCLFICSRGRIITVIPRQAAPCAPPTTEGT